MQTTVKADTLAVKDGLYVCPTCRQKTNQAADEATNAENLRLWCRNCKTTHIVNIVSGQCFVISRYR